MKLRLDKHAFEGPLDLLLTLIEGQKLDITQVALAEVTEQFLAHIRQLEELEPTELSDYLTIAAKLLVIKSKAILPQLELEPEEEEAAGDLEQQLLLYKQYKEIAKDLSALDKQKQQSFIRSAIFSEQVSFFPDPSTSTDSLHNAILKVVEGLKAWDNIPKAKIKQAISIQEKIRHLQDLLVGKIEMRLSDILSTAKNKHEAIVTFLALLELTKQRILTVRQEQIFAEITVNKLEISLESTNE